MRNLVEFDLCIEKEDPHPEDGLLEGLSCLAKSLFMCKLNTGCFDPSLESNFIINTPTSWCLPRLKVLFITVNHPDNVFALLPCT